MDLVSILNIDFVVRSFRSGIFFKFCSVLRFWGSWILRILDSKILFHGEILDILDLDFFVFCGVVEIRDSKLSLGREIP